MISLTETLARWRASEQSGRKWRLFTPPVWLRAPVQSFNFIFFHYIYLILMTIIGSVLLYPAGVLSYTDALFFSAGSATQSGLNTVDVNNLNLYQQIVIIIMASLCNPITINTFVVFVRLYWFEKRFRHIVLEAQTFRRNRSLSKLRTTDKEAPDLHTLESRVNANDIEVLHHTKRPSISRSQKPGPEDDMVISPTEERPSINSKLENRPTTAGQSSIKRDIVFADELPGRRLSNADRLPAPKSREQHIAFVENQQNPKEEAILRIPSPRDMELGKRPERVERDSVGPLGRRDSDESAKFAAEEADLKAAMPDQPIHRRLSNFGFPKALSISSLGNISFSRSREELGPQPYLSYTATIGRNSAFIGLSDLQKEELGGIEFRALKTLRTILIVYNVFFSIFGIIIFLPWIVRSATYSNVVLAVGESPVWWGIWTPISMFTDLGFTLTPDSMISFQTAAVPLLISSVLIVIGNTGFPCMLRLLIWIASKMVPVGSGIWEECMFLLDHPRRCFTLLFPRTQTWYLFLILILLNGIDLIFFIILDLHDPVVTSLPPIFQFVDGLFQAVSTRTAGTACVNIADLHPGIQVSYLVMMYISAYPIAISIRTTNTYEEMSLGIYSSATNDPEIEDEHNARSYLGSHLRRQLSFDLWFIFLGLFLICVIEGDRIQDVGEPSFSMFAVLFEIVSAYGTVGLSLGYPGTNASFSAQFRPLSKLIIIAMMLRGRHRGLPYALDRAILLPGEGLKSDKFRKQSASKGTDRQIDEQNAERRNTQASTRSPQQRIVKIIASMLSAGPAAKAKNG